MEEEDGEEDDPAMTLQAVMDDACSRVFSSTVKEEDPFELLMLSLKCRERNLQAMEEMLQADVDGAMVTNLNVEEDEENVGESGVLRKAKALLDNCERRTKFLTAQSDEEDEEAYGDIRDEPAIETSQQRRKLMEDVKTTELARRIEREARRQEMDEDLTRQLARIKEQHLFNEREMEIDQLKKLKQIEKDGEVALKLLEEKSAAERRNLMQNVYNGHLQDGKAMRDDIVSCSQGYQGFAKAIQEAMFGCELEGLDVTAQVHKEELARIEMSELPRSLGNGCDQASSVSSRERPSEELEHAFEHRNSVNTQGKLEGVNEVEPLDKLCDHQNIVNVLNSFCDPLNYRGELETINSYGASTSLTDTDIAESSASGSRAEASNMRSCAHSGETIVTLENVCDDRCALVNASENTLDDEGDRLRGALDNTLDDEGDGLIREETAEVSIICGKDDSMATCNEIEVGTTTSVENTGNLETEVKSICDAQRDLAQRVGDGFVPENEDSEGFFSDEASSVDSDLSVEQNMLEMRGENDIRRIIRVQAVVRGYLSRHKYRRLQREKHFKQCVSKLQAHWRGFVIRKKELLLDLKQWRARLDHFATKIQALWRGYRVKIRLKRALARARYIDDDNFDYKALDIILFNMEDTRAYDQDEAAFVSDVLPPPTREDSRPRSRQVSRANSVKSTFDEKSFKQEAQLSDIKEDSHPDEAAFLPYVLQLQSGNIACENIFPTELLDAIVQPSALQLENDLANKLSDTSTTLSEKIESCDSYESQQKRKDYISAVAQDWGFKNEKTVKLFLKACSKKRPSKEDGSQLQTPDAHKRRSRR